MSLVELQEGHHFVQIKVDIKIVIQGWSEVVDWEFAQVNSISIAVVNQMGDAIDVIPLQILGEVLAEEARIDWGELLSSILSDWLDKLVSNLRLAL